MKKNKIVISVVAVVCVIGIITGYNLIKQDSNKYNQLAIMTQQDDGTYIRSNLSTFGNDDYEFDHAVCNNRSTVTANSNGGVNLKLLGSDKCTVYLKIFKPVTEKIKESAQSSTSAMYSVVEPSNEIKSVTDDKFSKSQQTYTVDTTHQGYYMTYANTYTFNIPTTDSSGIYPPLYTLTSPQVAKYSDIYESLPGKYIVNYEGHNLSTAAKSNAIERIYKVVSATATSITYIPSSYTMEFTNSTTGVYTAEDDYGTSYYFRGNVTNNYVKFGKWEMEVYRGYNSDQSSYKEYFSKKECQDSQDKGDGDKILNNGCNKSPVMEKDMYWRIIRINGDGSLRLMYDGTEAHANGTSSLDRIALPYQKFNTNDNSNAYVGYMYGDTAGTTYDSVHKNTHNSAIKIALETWYEKNFVGTEYETKIGDMSFCNDRSVTSGTGIGTAYTEYGAYGRLGKNKSPSLVCPQKNDLFTKKDTSKGNGALTYPVGIPTADEAALIGGVVNLHSRGYFIYKGHPLWYSSAYVYNSKAFIFDSFGYGALACTHATNILGAIVPVINLSADAANKLKGSGTMEDPYHF